MQNLTVINCSQVLDVYKRQVENSWGPASGYQGHLIMTDEWFDEYMFRLVVEDVYKRQP